MWQGKRTYFFYQKGNVYLVEEVQNYTYNIWDCYFWELLNDEVRPDGKKILFQYLKYNKNHLIILMCLIVFSLRAPKVILPTQLFVFQSLRVDICKVSFRG